MGIYHSYIIQFYSGGGCRNYTKVSRDMVQYKKPKEKKKKRNMLKSLNFEDRIGNSFRSCEKFIDRIFHRFSIDTTIRLFNFGSFHINNIKIKEFLQNQRVRLPRIPRFHQIFLSKFIWKYISLNYPIKYFERRKVEKKKRKKRKTLITD